MVKQQLHKTVLVISMAILLLLSTIPSLAQSTDNVELVGIIESMTSTTITVNQQVINLTSAELNVPLEIGALVKIEGNLSEAGEITAREVNATDENAQAGEAELTGVLESFDGSTMVINGQVVDVSTAEIKAGIVIGELVKVHVTANDDGTWQAREAEPTAVPVQDDSTDDNSDDGLQVGEFEIVGTLDEIGDGFVVVSGQTIDVSTAEIKNLLVTGVLVKVHLQTVDGVLVGREIENHVGDDDSTVTNDNTNTNTNTNDNANTNTSTATAVSIEDVSATVLSIYPNTTIIEIELDDDFGDKLIWKVETSHGIELKIDAQTGVILTIEQDGNNNSNTNANDNSANTNSNDNVGSNNNSNSDDNNSNNNSNSNDNDDDDDNSGMGSDDDDDDNNSGMGSDDDDDDNSGMGSDDDD